MTLGLTHQGLVPAPVATSASLAESSLESALCPVECSNPVSQRSASDRRDARSADDRKIILIQAVFPPEPVVSAQMGRDVATHLAAGGFEVTVLCPFPSRPLGADFSRFGPMTAPHIEWDGEVKVVRLPSFRAPQSRIVGRMRESLSFGQSVCRYLDESILEADAIYANTWPLLSQALVARYCANKRIPLAMHIQDIYPESMLGRLPQFCRGPLSYPLRLLDRWIARRSTRVIVISEEMRRTYLRTRHVAEDKVLTQLNWADERAFEQMPGRSAACVHYSIAESKFTFLFLGNIGPVAGVNFLIEAFHDAQLPAGQLVIAGDGSAKASCIQRASQLGAANIHFISDPDANRVPLLQSLANVCLLPMRRGSGRSSIPSKLMAYLFSAKPVIAAVDDDSDTARCIQEAQCGWVEKPEDVQTLATRMREVAAMPSGDLARIGLRGRTYGLANFSKATGVRKLASIVLGAAGDSRS